MVVLWLSTIFGVALIGLALIVVGAGLVYLGATGDLELLLFGSWLKASSVGMIGIFCGAEVLGVIFRKAPKMLNRLAGTAHKFER
jgi:hypothetical protein